jgi:hypothetical protein
MIVQFPPVNPSDVLAAYHFGACECGQPGTASLTVTEEAPDPDAPGRVVLTVARWMLCELCGTRWSASWTQAPGASPMTQEERTDAILAASRLTAYRPGTWPLPAWVHDAFRRLPPDAEAEC